VDVLALLFGAKLVNPQAPETPELGQTQLATVVAPTFPIHGDFIEQNVTLTFPVDLITGLDTTYNLTCGEFYTLGVRSSHLQCQIMMYSCDVMQAANTPLTLTSQVTIFVASN
jgi:hypothetical protein